jgi:hypothetical protein
MRYEFANHEWIAVKADAAPSLRASPRELHLPQLRQPLGRMWDRLKRYR